MVQGLMWWLGPGQQALPNVFGSGRLTLLGIPVRRDQAATIGATVVLLGVALAWLRTSRKGGEVMPEEATEIPDKQQIAHRRFDRCLHDRLKVLNTPELLAEHKAAPPGSHSDALAQVLNYFRRGEMPGDENALGPGFVEEDVPGAVPEHLHVRRPFTQKSSYAEVWGVEVHDVADDSFTLAAFDFPTAPGTRRQMMLGRWDIAGSQGWALGINPEGHLEFWGATGGTWTRLPPRCR